MKETVSISFIAVAIFVFGFGVGCWYIGAETNTILTTETNSLANDFSNSRIETEKFDNIIKWWGDEPRLRPIIIAAKDGGRITQEEYTDIMDGYLDIIHADRIKELRDGNN